MLPLDAAHARTTGGRVNLNLWLLHWLLSARAFLATDGHAGLESARERVSGREFWQLRDPHRPSISGREARRRRAIGYRVMIEVGLEAELPNFVRMVGAVLDDPRGWRAGGRELVPVEDHERFTILLARPSTVDRLCQPLKTIGQFSCGREGRAALNLSRWREGAVTWGEDIAGYRVYMVNHEVGHLLGMPHAGCDAPEQPAAVMLQQTMRLDGCEPHAWPSPGELERMRSRWGSLLGGDDR